MSGRRARTELVTVAVASERDIVRAGVLSLLSRHPRRLVAHTQSDGHADVVLLDTGRGAAGALTEHPAMVGVPAGVIVLIVDDLVHAGVSVQRPDVRVVSLGIPEQELVNVLLAAADGARAGRRASQWLGAEQGLTRRESDVLELLAMGKTNAEIAEAMYINIETVKSHLKRIYHCLGARNRTHAAAWALNEHRGRPHAAEPDAPRPSDEGTPAHDG